MYRQIIKQPNGKLAIWSHFANDFIITNATPEEYIDFRIKEESERITREIYEIVDKLDRDVHIGYYDLTWDTALERLEQLYGKEKLESFLKQLSNEE